MNSGICGKSFEVGGRCPAGLKVCKTDFSLEFSAESLHRVVVSKVCVGGGQPVDVKMATLVVVEKSIYSIGPSTFTGFTPVYWRGCPQLSLWAGSRSCASFLIAYT